MAFETQLGLPVFLAYLDEHIFEKLPLDQAKAWPLSFIEAVPVGADLELVFPRFMHWLLSDPLGVRRHANAETVLIIDSLVRMYADRINGVPFNERAAARAESAAWTLYPCCVNFITYISKRNLSSSTMRMFTAGASFILLSLLLSEAWEPPELHPPTSLY